MSYNIHYNSPDRAANDAKALDDMRNWCGKKRWEILIDAAKTANVETLMMLCEFAGVRGYPVQAFLRLYKLPEFIEWLRSEEPPVQCDDAGFPLKEAAQ